MYLENILLKIFEKKKEIDSCKNDLIGTIHDSS